MDYELDYANTSGQGENTKVPKEVSDKFNFGAFLLSWIWGVYYQYYISLLVIVLGLVPFVGPLLVLGFCIWLGIKGNAVAWKNKQYKNIEEFHLIQKKWAIAGIILAIIGFAFTCTVLGAMNKIVGTMMK